jgi:hypothetical protein
MHVNFGIMSRVRWDFCKLSLELKMRTTVAIAVALSLISCGNALAQVASNCKFKTCSGGTPVPHGDNGYRFDTSSIIYPMKKTGRVVYETCVENKSNRDFEINWYIPGPEGWLLRGCALKSPRQRKKEKTIDGYAGCLRYGNQWYPDRAEFVPHGTDLPAITDEKQKDCRQVIAQDRQLQASSVAPGKEGVETADLRTPVTEELETFAPFDPKEPEATMVHIVAHVLLQPSEDLKSFKHTVRWEIAKAYANGPAYEGNLLVSPENGFVREVYQSQQLFGSRPAVPLNPEKPLVADFPMPPRPDLGSVRYRFLTTSGMPVASMFVPMWLPNQ